MSEVNDDPYSEIREKQQEVYADKVVRQHDEMQARKQEELRIKGLDLSKAETDRINQLADESDEYLKAAREAKIFLNDDFRGIIPFFPRNILLAAASTGDGKSTTSANLTTQTLKQGGRVLVITNEEHPADVYNRVTCLLRGWSYANHANFTEEQRKTFRQSMLNLSKRLSVIDNTYNNSFSHTTSLEGVRTILMSLVEKKVHYDLIILDYYQNINVSVENPQLKDWEVQHRLGKFLDTFKNVYPAPIVVLAQMKPRTDGLSFKEAIEGRKSILNVATCAIEVVAERDLKRTAWTIRKSRFAETVGKTIYTGYDRGAYVRYDQAFKERVQMQKQQEERNQVMSQVNVSNGNR